MKSIGIFVGVRKEPAVLGPSIFRYLFAKSLAFKTASRGIDVFCFDWTGLDVDPKGNLFVSSCWKWNAAATRKQGRFVKTDSVSYPDMIIDSKLYLKRVSLKEYPNLRRSLSLKGSVPERQVGEAVLKKFKLQGVRVLTAPAVSSLVRNKWAFYDFMEAHKSRHFFQPETVLINNPRAAVDLFVSRRKELKGLILKPVSGSGGKDIRLFTFEKYPLEDIKKKIAKIVSASKKEFILQEFVEPLPCRSAKSLDLRMFYGLGTVFTGYCRYSVDSEISNVARGGKTAKIPSRVLSEHGAELEKATLAVGSSLSELGDIFLVSVDFMLTKRGLCLIEANGQPGFDKKAQASDILRINGSLAQGILSGKA